MKKVLNLLLKRKQKRGSPGGLDRDAGTPFGPPKNPHPSFDPEPGLGPEIGLKSPSACPLPRLQSFTHSSHSEPEKVLQSAENCYLESLESEISKSSSDGELLENSPLGKQEKREGKKSKKNMCVIQISNCKYFHIGSQKTININEKPKSRATEEDIEVEPHAENSILHLQTKLKSLLDCEEKLTEKYITLISLHVNDQWKNFMKNLGLEETLVEVLESRNDYNRVLTVYDAVHRYKTIYPNTSLGFVVYASVESQQVALIEKLALQLKPG